MMIATNATSALLLEDEPLISMDLENTLRKEGYEVTTLMSSIDAEKWLDNHRPDVAIVDIKLRDGPCILVVTRLLNAAIPFVVHTGDDPSFHVDSPFALGTWVAKPAHPNALLKALSFR